MSVTAVRPARLAGLNSSHKPREYISQTTKAWNAPPPPKNNLAPCCPNAKCNGTPLVRDDEGLLCPLCGQVAEDSNIVSEVQFGETAGGAAMVEGGFIGDQQRHANSMGGTMRGLGGMESREQALWNAKITIDAIGSSLLQRSQVLDQAYSWYKLASNHNFIRGRRIRNVAAVAIYMAARRQTDNTLMLMDLSEKIQTNVWELGNTYKDFLKLLGEKDPAQLADKDKRATQEIEPLMLKYCRKLEFGEDSYQVAADACKIAKRMKRDWMIEGRQPAGICGACIILAARMNNYRRTVREVVYVVKVGDSTINNRLYEYKKTPSSALTVKQFREFGQRMKVKTLPPAIWRREEKEERKEKKRARAAGVDEGEGSNAAGADPSVSDNSETGANAAPTRASKRRKSNDGSSQAVTAEPGSSTVQPSQENVPATIDADALDGNAEAVLETVANAVADAETDNAGDADFVMPKKRGRQPKKRQVIEIDPDDLEIEQEIENEVAEEIINWESIFKEFAVNENHEVFQRTGWTARQLTAAHTDTRDINLSADIGEDEFEDDPDVASCILNPEEVRLKEAIWITENDDWLREQQKKMLEAELEAAQDKPKKPKQKRKHHQMGDGSVLGGQPAASAAEAAQKMLNRRAPTFSNHVNYDKLKELFGDGTAVSTPSGSGLGASPAASQNQRSPPALPVTAPTANEEDEEEEEEEEMEYEGEAYDEEEDLEHAYRDDDDEGFGNDYADDY